MNENVPVIPAFGITNKIDKHTALLGAVNRMKSLVVLTLLSCFVGWIAATISLANSGYPMPGANPQRNNKVDKPVLCSNVSNGKTTVLNVIWQFPEDPLSSLQVQSVSYNMIQDGQGFGYVIAYDSGPKMFKINTTDGSYNSGLYYIPTGYPEITMLGENKFYYSTTDKTIAVETTTFTETLSYLDPIGYGSVPMAPYKNDWMVKTRQVTDLANTDNAVQFFKDSLSDVDYTQPNIKYSFVGLIIDREILVYKSTTSAAEYPVIVAVPSEFGGPSAVASPSFFNKFDQINILEKMIVGDEIILLHQSQTIGGVLVLDAVTGDVTLNKSYVDWNSQPFFLNQGQLMYHNGKALAGISVELEPYFVDLVNAQLISTNDFRPFARSFSFSNVDETVLSLGMSKTTQYFEITGLKWDTFDVNVRARLPTAGNDATYGSVIIGDDCRVHVGVNHILYTLAPLPIQKVVPILECVDRNTSMAYFTYNNTGSTAFSMPQVLDRNNLSPLNVAPVEVFKTGLGPLYPLSAKVKLTGSSYTWVLEDYVLTFTITPDLYCPETINIVIVLTADGPFPAGFDQIVRTTFVNVTGISDSRVTIVNGQARRSINQQNTLETELEISPDPSNTEPTPAEVVQSFAQSSQYTFQQQIQQAEGAPSNIDVTLAGKQQPTAVQGEIPPEPVATPMSSPVASAPVATPVSKPTSAASTLHIIANIIVIVVVMML